MNRLLKLLPEITGEEMTYLQQTTKELNDDDLELFASIYRARRRDPQNVLILALVGLCILPGVQRLYVDQIGMGILYFFTLGLCIIGSVVDIINYKSLAFEYNSKVITEAFYAIRR